MRPRRFAIVGDGGGSSGGVGGGRGISRDDPLLENISVLAFFENG